MRWLKPRKNLFNIFGHDGNDLGRNTFDSGRAAIDQTSRLASRDRPPAEVESVDGQLLVLSPWAVRNLRFDEALMLNYGFDLDICLQARAAGRRVVVADIAAVYHRSVELVSDLDVWIAAHVQVAEKWDGTLRGPVVDEGGWKRRARRAEADREAQRAIAFSTSLKLDARVLELERQLEEKTSSLSWRLTAPKAWWSKRQFETIIVSTTAVLTSQVAHATEPDWITLSGNTPEKGISDALHISTDLGSASLNLFETTSTSQTTETLPPESIHDEL